MIQQEQCVKEKLREMLLHTGICEGNLEACVSETDVKDANSK